jgi:hypothetical protein
VERAAVSSAHLAQPSTPPPFKPTSMHTNHSEHPFFVDWMFCTLVPPPHTHTNDFARVKKKKSQRAQNKSKTKLSNRFCFLIFYSISKAQSALVSIHFRFAGSFLFAQKNVGCVCTQIELLHTHTLALPKLRNPDCRMFSLEPLIEKSKKGKVLFFHERFLEKSSQEKENKL